MTKHRKLTDSERAVMLEAYEFDKYETMLLMGAPFAVVLERCMADDARSRVVAADPESGVFAIATSVDEMAPGKVG